MNFPYAKRFRYYLQNDRMLENSTINDIEHDVDDLFNYLRKFNVLYQNNPDLSDLEETDIKTYFNMLQLNRNIKNTTYNKVLTHLNTYFIFLFQNKLSNSLPTIALKGLKRTKESTIRLDWTNSITEYLTDENLSYYTRMVLLLISHFYTITEILQPNFYQVVARENFADSELKFLTAYNSFLAPLQKKQGTSNLFLKQHINLADPCLTLPALHKYLKKDQPKINIALQPRQLYQNAICYFIISHQELSDSTLSNRLRLQSASLNYYRQLNGNFFKS